MYFSRLTLKESRSKEFYNVFKEQYSIHKLIWKIFSDSKDRKRDYIYLVKDNMTIYTISYREPVGINSIWDIETKLYNPKIERGMYLEFMLKVNPVVSRKITGKQVSSRHDVIMDEIYRQRDLPEKTARIDLVEQEGTRWLKERAVKNGFSILDKDIRIDGYRQERFFKENKKIQISTIEISGILKVEVKETFLKTLYNGLGSAKGFGCGMMLIKKLGIR